MRITYIVQHFRTPDQPGGTRPYAFAERLVAAGHEVTIICAGTRRLQSTVNGIKIQQLPVRYDNHMSPIRRILSFSLFMLRAVPIASGTPTDIVFASSTPLTVIIPGVIAARLKRVPMILEVRDLWPEAPIELGALPRLFWFPARMLERFGYSQAQHIIPLSPGMEDGIRRINSHTPTTMIPNASDILDPNPYRRTKIRDMYQVQQGQPLFIYAGSLGRIYSPQWLASLAHAVTSRGGRMIIAGDGALKNDAMAHLRKLGVDPELIFIGQIPRREVVELLLAADVVVSSVDSHPTLRHASINKIFDGLGAGRPILMNHGGWLCDLVVAEGAGVRMDNIDESTLAILFDESSRDALGNQARSLARQHFDRELLFGKFLRVMETTSKAGDDA